jgi:parallel beta-helix repeat protein
MASTTVALAGDPTPPPGPVAGTMKTLDEVEPRIPIGPLTTPGQFEATYWISEPGSYFLTGNMDGEADKIGIYVDAPDVTIDLGGFTMTGAPLVSLAWPAIYVGSGNTNIEVRNGTIAEWTGGGVMFDESTGGIDNISAVARDLRIRDCTGWGIIGERDTTVLNCHITGCLYGGVRLTRTKSQVLDTIASSNTGPGIQTSSEAIVRNCVADVNGDTGIIVGGLSVVTGCIASINQSASGFDLGDGSVAENCTAAFNTAGFTINGAAALTNCTSRNNSQHGFQDTSLSTSDNGAVLRACIARENGASGFFLSSEATMVDCSSVENIGVGLLAGDGLSIRGGVVEDNNDGGISAGAGASIESVKIANNTGAGFGLALGVDSAVRNCEIIGNAATGVDCPSGDVLIEGCTVADNGGHGLRIANDSKVDGCVIRNNGDSGVQAGSYCFISNNLVNNNGDAIGEAGIRVFEGCRIEGNTLTQNFRGVRMDDNRNVVVRNTFILNGSPQLEDVNSNNQNAPSPVGVSVAGPWDNIAH